MSKAVTNLPTGAAEQAAGRLLGDEDGAPFEVINGEGQSGIVLICEHASNRVPEKLAALGLNAAQLRTHVAWDPGALELARALSRTLDAPLVAARFSRLVYDCNRPPDAPSAMPHDTEACRVPGNTDLSDDARMARVREIYDPFHAAVAAVMDATRARVGGPVAVSVHSFTPVFKGERRHVDIGYLHSKNDRLAQAMRRNSRSVPALDIRLNQPYGPADGVLHTLDRHTAQGVAAHVMIEVRNDHLDADRGLQAIHDMLAAALKISLEQIL